MKKEYISSDARNQFLKRLGVYAKNKTVQILIVFDGGDVSFNYIEKIYGIEALYSGFLESADDVIMRYINNYRSQEDLMVISSDREILDLAISRYINVLKSEEFYNLLQASELGMGQVLLALSNQVNKITKSNIPELDELMELASRDMIIKPEPILNLRKANTQKLSKNELQKQRKLKKL